MGLLDIRLLELIETLAVAHLDWLAFELIDEIQAGHVPEEPEEELAAARRSIRTNAQPKARSEPQVVAAEPKPIPIDDQVEWAAAYIDKRLDQALEQQLATVNILNFIFVNTTEQLEDKSSVAQVPGTIEGDVSMVVMDTDDDRKISSKNIIAARDGISALREALAEWTIRARGQTPT